MPGQVRHRRGRHRRLPAVIAAAILATGLATGVASAALEDRIDSAEEEAKALSEKLEQRSGQIESLEAEAAEARGRIDELTGELANGQERSAELAAELRQAERAVEEAQARLERAKVVLADRLVAIYKGADPDYLDLVLESADFEDLTSRAAYLEQIKDADATIVERVEDLKAEVEDDLVLVSETKAAIDQHNRELVSARTEVTELRGSLAEQAAELAEAAQAGSVALEDLRAQIETWKAELGTEQTAALFGEGPWVIPAYIVMCESGGNFRAYNPSSGAGGAYQIIPSTWKRYGGKGLAHTAPPAEQHRIAAMIWRDSGPGAWSCA